MTGIFNKIRKQINIVYLAMLLYFMFLEFCYEFHFWPLPSQINCTYKIMGFMGILMIVLLLIDDIRRIKDPINISIICIYISLIIPYFFNNYSYIHAIFVLSKHSYWLLFAFLYMYNIRKHMAKNNFVIIGYFFIACVFIAMTMTYVLYINQMTNYALLNFVYPVIDSEGCTFGIFNRHNIGAPFSVFSIIISCLLIKDNKCSKIFHIFNIIYNLPYLYLSTSRNNQLGLLFFAIISIIAYMLKKKSISLKKIVLSSVASLPLLYFLIYKLLNNERSDSSVGITSIINLIRERKSDELFNMINRLSNGRMVLWRDAFINSISHGKKRILFGVGSENYKLNDIVVGWSSIGHPHNIFFASFLNTGIFGLISICSFYIITLYKTFISSFKSNKNKGFLYFGIIICTIIMCSLEMYGLYASYCPSSTIMWIIYAFILNDLKGTTKV